jgi:hypothetical protein
LTARFQAPIDVDAFTFQSAGPPLVDVYVGSGSNSSVELVDGGTFRRRGGVFTGRREALKRLELRPSNFAPVGVDYTVTVIPITDDFDEAVPVLVAVGAAQNARFEFFDDVDVFAVDLPASTAFGLFITGCSTFTLVRPGGLAEVAWSGVGFNSDVAGRYLLRADASQCGSDPYSFTVTSP